MWRPHLDMFLRDEFLPNAILIEYIPHMQMIDLQTFSTDRMNKFVNILKDIHRAKVLHHDPYPRNMMVVPGDPERILWIDFDRAQTYSGELTPRQQKRFDHEVELVDYFAKALVSGTTPRQSATWDYADISPCLQAEDHGKGQLRKAWHYYFDGMSPDFCDRTFGPNSGYH